MGMTASPWLQGVAALGVLDCDTEASLDAAWLGLNPKP